MHLEVYLHDKGYNYFNMGKLTHKEIRQLIDGDIVRQHKQEKDSLIREAEAKVR